MNPVELAARFARCLDAEDYGGAAACLADTCRYDAGLIRAIRHVDLPGEASALQAFYVRAGLADAGTRAEPEA